MYNQYNRPSSKYINSYEEYDGPKKKSDDCKISCQKVLDHISNCPICNKFYNNDRTVYIIIIVILIIISLLLFKKVLNV